MPLAVGLSRPSREPRRRPHTGAVAKIRPVLAALVRLRPNVKPVWAVATPKQPSAAIGRRSPLFSPLFGSRARRTPYMTAPPTVNRSATNIVGGMASTAYFVAAKLSPQKTAAKTSATSVATAPRSPGPLTGPAKSRISPHAGHGFSAREKSRLPTHLKPDA